MSDEHIATDQSERPSPDRGDPSDTLIVPPPTFRERLLAAQRARATEARLTVDIPDPVQSSDSVGSIGDAAQPPSNIS